VESEGRSIYQVRLVTHARDLVLAIDVAANTAASAEQLVKSLQAIRISKSDGESSNFAEGFQ
jgi:hypothetical protein